MKTALIIINSYFMNASYRHQINTLADQADSLDIKTDIIKSCDIDIRITDGKIRHNLKPYDFILFLEKDLYLAKCLEKAGYKLFNKASAIETCDDKMKTHIALSGSGINMPETIFSPIMYKQCEDLFDKTVLKRLSLPLVIKKCYGSMGSGVFLAKTEEELKTIREQLKCEPHIYQKFITESSGKDLRIIVINKKAVACMRRINKTDFRSNIDAGGKGYLAAPDKAYIKCAEKCAQILDLDYCGVDMLETASGPLILEVNSNAFFKSVMNTTKINIAKLYLEHIYKKVYEL